MLSGSAISQLNYRRKDGTTLTGEVSSTFFVDRKGEPRTVNIIRDITERKQAEQELRKAYERIQLQNEELQAQSEELQLQNEELQTQSEELQEAYETLRESEERFRSVLDGSRDVIYRLNMQTGRFEYINPSAEDVVGFSPDELMAVDAETPLAMIHPDDLPAMREALARLEDTGIGELEYRQRTKNGDYRWISNRMSLIKDSAGRTLYRDGNIRDITERKKAEERLAYQANLLANISDVVYSTDDKLRLTSWNQEAEKVYGWKEEEVLGKDVIEVTGSTLNPETRNSLTVEMQERGAVTAEIEHTTISGEHIIFDSSTMPLRDAGGKIVGYVAVNRNITDRKRAKEALRESEAKLNSLFELLPIGVSILDQKRNTITTNPALESILGITTEGFADRVYDKRRYIHADGSDFAINDMPSTVVLNEKSSVSNVEIGVVREDGSLIWTNVNAVPLPYSDWNAVVTTVDITERKKAEEALKKARDSLEEKVKERTAELEEAYNSLLENEMKTQ